MCAGNVVNTNVPCCGMAGDRGMRYPELTAASLQVGAMVVGRKGGMDSKGDVRACDNKLVQAATNTRRSLGGHPFSHAP